MHVAVLTCRRFGFIAVLACRRFGYNQKRRHTKTVGVCRRFGVSQFWMCRRFGCRRFGSVAVLVVAVLDVSPFWLSLFWIVAVLTGIHTHWVTQLEMRGLLYSSGGRSAECTINMILTVGQETLFQ